MLPFQNYRNKIVRDLAWVIGSPPLLTDSKNDLYLNQSFYDKEYQSFSSYLEKLDKDQTELVDHIENGNTRLLGKYFESLVEFWLRKSEDKKLLAHNLQVFRGRNTIGEFDFVYRDLNDGKVYHLECAGKFYISHKSSAQHSNFIGPNAIDNLGRKVNKIINDQIPLGQSTEGREALLIEGVEEIVAPKIFLKGYLFYQADLLLDSLIVLPENANPDHPKGWWIYSNDIDYFLSQRKSKWIIIDRMNRISKVISPFEEKVLSNEELVNTLKSYFSKNTYPLLIAELQENEKNVLEEITRGFIVHDTWPKAEF